MRMDKVEHKFVKFVPAALEEGVVYVSIDYGTASHSCCCGCGEKVVTPITPTDWKIIFNGETISLHPSIGNWSFECRSHYWVRENQIVWVGDMSSDMVEAIRKHDRQNKNQFYNQKKLNQKPINLFTKLKNWFK